MPLRDILIVLTVTIIWGVNFVVIKVGMEGYPPLLFCAIRYIIASLPLLVLGFQRPARWSSIILVGLAFGVGQFGLVFVAIKLGMSAGLTSLILQGQILFSVFLAWIILKERPKAKTLIGVACAAVGLALIGAERLDGLSGGILPFLLVIGAAFSFAVSNLGMRTSGATDMLRFITWVSLIPPLPLLALSWGLEGPDAMVAALQGTTWVNVAGILFIAVVSTTLTWGAWAGLLTRHPVAKIVPYGLIVPVAGLLSGALLIGERLSQQAIIASALILLGLAIAVMPRPGFLTPKPAARL